MRWSSIAVLSLGLLWVVGGSAQEAESGAAVTELGSAGQTEEARDDRADDEANPDGESETAPRRSYPDDPFYHTEGSWEQDFADQWALRDLRVYTDVAGSFEHDRGISRQVEEPMPSTDQVDQPALPGPVLVDTPDGPTLVFFDTPATDQAAGLPSLLFLP